MRKVVLFVYKTDRVFAMSTVDPALHALLKAYNEMSTQVYEGGRCDVCVYVTGSKGLTYCSFHPHGDEDVEDFLLEICRDNDISLGRCRITLNGRKFDVHKGMKVRDLADDPGNGCPWFVIN